MNNNNNDNSNNNNHGFPNYKQHLPYEMDPNHESPAIKVENAYKRHSKKLPFVLEKLCMTVPKCSIYSLLGASGCGKTTLLSCIIGQNILDSGSIKLSIASKRQLGYMPQQISIFPEFTISEMLSYYGLIYNLSPKQIQAKSVYLQKLLHLNKFSRKCGSLSGGQQRRVSLAITLLHDPELLILDEPTSGIDPLIAEEIWCHLLDLARNGTTILITTHYIDEAKKSHMIGLMRKGVLLEESPPNVLLEKYQMESLEEVFLILSSQQQHNRLVQKRKSETDAEIRRMAQLEIEQTMKKKSERTLKSVDYIRGSRLKSQLWKHYLWMKRNPGVIVFMTFIPMVCVFFFNLAIGHLPNDIPIGIYNSEANFSHCQNISDPKYLICGDNGMYSCTLLQKIRQQNMKLIEYNDTDTARLDIKRNVIWGFLNIPENFTVGMENRLKYSLNMDPVEIETMLINVEMDQSDFIMSIGIKRGLKRAFKNFVISYADVCDFNVRLADVPPFLMSSLFGTLNSSYTQFAGPAILILVLFYCPFLFTTSALITEKTKGIIERSLIAGMTIFEVILAHFIIQMLVLIAEIILSVWVQYYIFNHVMVGNMALALLLLFFQGVVGTFTGLLTAFICSSDMSAGLILIGSTIPFVFLTGLMWPVEGIQVYAKYIARAIPLTYPIDSYRSIAFRGYGVTESSVYIGFLSSTIWIVLMCLISVLLLKYKKALI